MYIFLKEKICRYRRNKSHQSVIVYANIFQNKKDLANHFFRAAWYLPYHEDHCQDVIFFTKGKRDKLSLEKPQSFSEERFPTDHLTLKNASLIRYIIEVRRAKALIFHEKSSPLLKFILVKILRTTKNMVEVNTDDQKIREYANYPGMYWKYLLSDKEKKAEIRKNYGLFLSVCSKLEYKKAVIIATGPSSGNINHLNFRDALVISCNSKVRDIEFLDKHKPKFICAGDVVSHLGISKYAGQFRADLLRYINDHGGFFVCTLTFGLIFKKHFPEYDNKIILIPQGENGVLFDLKQHFQLPILSSTLNIHMLPSQSALLRKFFWSAPTVGFQI